MELASFFFTMGHRKEGRKNIVRTIEIKVTVNELSLSIQVCKFSSVDTQDHGKVLGPSTLATRSQLEF